MNTEQSDRETPSRDTSQKPTFTQFVFTNPRKKIGQYATKAMVEVKHLLKQDVPLPPADKLLETIQSNRIQQGNNKTISEIREIVQRSREVLIHARTPYLLKLFPDEVIVDRSKITLIKRNFFWSADMVSIRIEDVLNVTTSVGPILGSINFASRVMNSVDHFQIGPFWRETAVDLKHIVQGYMIARNNKLDTDHLSIDELVSTLSELGHDSGAI